MFELWKPLWKFKRLLFTLPLDAWWPQKTRLSTYNLSVDTSRSRIKISLRFHPTNLCASWCNCVKEPSHNSSHNKVILRSSWITHFTSWTNNGLSILSVSKITCNEESICLSSTDIVCCSSCEVFSSVSTCDATSISSGLISGCCSNSSWASYWYARKIPWNDRSNTY